MNESEENKELIQRIAETLRSHAEPYKEGAWERFSAAQGIRRKRVLWPYWSAAAVLLVAAALFLVNPVSNPPAPKIVSLNTEKEQPIPSVPAAPLAPIESQKATVVQPSDNAESSPKPMPHQTQQNATAEIRTERLAVEQTTVPTSDTPAEGNIDAENTKIKEPDAAVEAESETPDSPTQRLAAVDQQATPEMPARATEHFSKKQEYATIHEETRSGAERKWDLGLAVAPSMTSEKLNLSGGIAVAYQLSDKFSVGSGISIGRLGMGENPNYDPSSGEPPQYHSPSEGIQGLAKNREEYKRDITLTSDVVALDIPLDFRYEVFNGFYTSVGVSYVAVLSEQRTEHFIGGLNETTFGSDKGADKNLAASTTVGYVSEKMDVQPLKGKGYAGFMNFSIGRKISLSKHIFFSIEPYFKLPIGQLSNEQMDFTNGGIRIVTGF